MIPLPTITDSLINFIKLATKNPLKTALSVNWNILDTQTTFMDFAAISFA